MVALTDTSAQRSVSHSDAVLAQERSPLLAPQRLSTEDYDDDADQRLQERSGSAGDVVSSHATGASRRIDQDDRTRRSAPPEDLEAASTPVPFPTQPDPRKPLRPDHYHLQRAAKGLRGFWRRNEGLALIGIAQLFYSTMSLFFKLLHNQPDPAGGRIGALEIILVRMGITWLGCVGYMFCASTPHPVLGPPGVRRLLVLRGVVGYGGLFSLYYSLSYLSLSDATVITFLAPLATGLLGYLLLGETFSARQAIAGFTSICGVLLIARPRFLFGDKAESVLDPPVGEEAVQYALAPSPVSTYLSATAQTGAPTPTASLSLNLARKLASGLALAMEGVSKRDLTPFDTAPPDDSKEPDGVTEAQRILAVGVALFGVLCAASAYTTVRAIGQRATPMHSVAYFALYSSLLSALLMHILGEPFVLPQTATWCVLLFCVGIFGLAAQILATMGLQRESAGRATSAVYTQVVWSTLFQLAVLRTPVHPWSAAGCVVILGAAIFVAVSK